MVRQDQVNSNTIGAKMMKSWQAIVGGGLHALQPTPQFSITLFTSLDLHRSEELPAFFSELPRKGDLIESTTEHPLTNKAYRLVLEVVGVKHSVRGIEIELHLPQYCIPYDAEEGSKGQKTLRAWYRQIYEPIAGGWYI
jgi:hypothetical protein